MLENSPSLRTIELAKYFDVTDETIRRDLETLDAENKLIRTHGGALRIEKRSAELPLQKRLNENRAAKQEIAKKAIGLVSPSDTIFLDASSTVLTFAESAARHKNNRHNKRPRLRSSAYVEGQYRRNHNRRKARQGKPQLLRHIRPFAHEALLD